MAKNKEPSIFDDRGTIGSSDELDEYGVWVKTEPQDLASDGADMSELFSESSADYSVDDPEFSSTDDMDFAIPDMDDLPDLDTLGVEAAAGATTNIFAEDEGIGEEIYFDENYGSQDLESDQEDGGYSEVSMEDFIETVDDEATADAASTALPDLSTQLLMRIADELSSIRNELTSLKKQFSGFKAGNLQGDGAEISFYEEEDDEKISLTGDELNNIINTAEFSEETGADVGLELSDDDDIQDVFESSSAEDDTLQLSTADLDTEIDLGDTGFENEKDSFAADLSLDEIPIDFDLSDDLDISGASVEESISDFPLDDIEETGETEELEVTSEESIDLSALTSDETEFLAEDSIDFSELNEELDLSLETDDTPIEDMSIDDISIEDVSIDDMSIEEPLPEDISISLEPSEFDSGELTSGELDSEELISEKPEFDLDEISIPVSEEGLDLDIPPEDLELSTEDIPLTDLELITEGSPLADLSLIPEGFGMDEAEAGSAELGSDDFTSAELDSSELDSIELDSAELSSEELDSLELGSVEFDSDEPGFNEFPSEELISDDFLTAPVEIEAAESGIEIEEEPSGTFSGMEDVSEIPSQLKEELKSVLSYMDQLLEALPEEKIEEFARSEYYETYKKLFKDLGLV